jgi:hypothetical protein
MVGVYYFDSELEFTQDTNLVLQIPNPLPAGLPCAVAGWRSNPTLGDDSLCQFPNARSAQRAGEDVQSFAIFGSVNFRPWEDWEFSVGVRNIQEGKDVFNS